MSMNYPLNHLRTIWYHSEPLDKPVSCYVLFCLFLKQKNKLFCLQIEKQNEGRHKKTDAPIVVAVEKASISVF